MQRRYPLRLHPADPGTRWFIALVAAVASLSSPFGFQHPQQLAYPRVLLASALSPSTSSSSSSPWKAGYWQLTVDLGRRNGGESSSSSSDSTTWPDDDWGAAGARLVFPVAIGAHADAITVTGDAYWQGSTANRLDLCPDIVESSYITAERGQQTVPLASLGGWKLSRQGARKGEASLLRFWLDLVDHNNNNKEQIVAQKQDVTLCAGDRLYFAAHAWRESEYEAGVRRMRPIEAAYRQAKDALAQQVSHDDGDRRLDGTNALDTLAAYRDMAALTLDRDQKRRAWQDAQDFLPPAPPAGSMSSTMSRAFGSLNSNQQDSRLLPMGHWPGSTELLAIQPREVILKRRGKGVGGIFGMAQDEFYVVGKWSVKPLELEEEDDDDEYEYYYEDDEEDEEDKNDDEEYKQSSIDNENRVER